MKYVVTYDVIDDKRRNKIFKLLKDYGRWVQHSVFEVEVNDTTWLDIEFALTRLLKEEDSLCVYPICKSCAAKAFYAGTFRYALEEDKNPII
jgi:CRISPR-associated protein Cas2